MLLTGLPQYNLGQVVLPSELKIGLDWLENGDVEIASDDTDLIRQIEDAILAAGIDVQEVADYIAARDLRDQQEQSATDAETGARAWYAGSPNASLLFTLSIPELEAEISTLIDQILPLATAGQRAKLKLLLTTYGVAIRVLAKREGFVD